MIEVLSLIRSFYTKLMRMTRKIYTKTGDRGITSIAGGERVEKDDIRIEVNGTIDELNSIIGIIRSMMATEHPWQQLLYQIQRGLMETMQSIATPEVKKQEGFPPSLSNLCEKTMDNIMATLKEANFFILPGGTTLSAHLHLARTVTRRAERRLWTMNKTHAVDENILLFFNRLSDLFFVLAKQELQQQGISEERWNAFSYRKKNDKNK